MMVIPFRYLLQEFNMPLNSFQRETLHNTVISCVDTILAQPLAYELKIHWLKEVISNVLPTIPETIQTLKQHMDLIQGLATAANVPITVREDWIGLLRHISNNADQLPPTDLLQRLATTYNNYNPLLLASIHRFENELSSSELGCIKAPLIRLREIYLEMTPLTSYSYGTNHQTFYCRIGNVPLNLDHSGPIPEKGEVQADVLRLINDRIEQAEKHQKDLQEKEHEHKLRAEIAAKATEREQDFAFAVSLHLNEEAEQRRGEQFKQRVASTLEATPREHLQSIHFADLFFPKTQNSIESYALYLLFRSTLTTFETAPIQKAIVLSFDPQGSSNSSGFRQYEACFIENGQWLKEGSTLILKVDMGDLYLPIMQEGLLEKNANLLQLMQTAIFKRDQFIKQQTESSTVKTNFIFFQMQGALNNRITATLEKIKEKIIALDRLLKQSQLYLALRKAEFCKILLQVQQSAVTTCLTNTVDWNSINQTYQEQLAVTYHMYIADACVKWMSDRAPHLQEAALEIATQQFKSKIDELMDKDLQQYKALILGPKNIKKLPAQLSKTIEDLDLKLNALKTQWDDAIFPLSNLTDECNIVKRLRTELQISKTVDWYTPLEELQRVDQHVLQDVPDTLDQDGFTLLHYACWCGHIELVKVLLAQNYKISTPSKEGFSACHFAVQNTSNTAIPLLELLLQESHLHIVTFPSKIKKIPLHIAASKGNLAAVDWLLKKVPTTLNVTDDTATTPLHEAARNGHSDVVQHLLNLSANAHALNTSKKSPILLGVLEGHRKTTQVFVEAGFCLNTQETEICLKMIENQHPNSRTIIDCMAVPLTHTAHTLSQLNIQTHAVVARQAPSYLPLYQSQSENMPPVPPEESPSNTVSPPAMEVSENKRETLD